jgi:DNA-binding transcriptional MerR regulator
VIRCSSDALGTARRELIKLYRTSEAARIVGVSSQTLRTWESKGLVQPRRSEGGHRRYAIEDVQQASEIAALRHHGWTPAALRASGALQPSLKELPVGQRIRTTRKALRLTIAELASRIGVSASFLSAVERGESGVSNRVLVRLAEELEIPQSAFWAETQDAQKLVLRHSERPRIEVEGGIRWEELGPPGHRISPSTMIVPEGESSGGPAQVRGEAFAYVVSGQLTVTLPLGSVNERTDTLEAHDSLFMPSGIAMSWSNPGPGPTQVLWCEEILPGMWERVGWRPAGRSVLAKRGETDVGVLQEAEASAQLPLDDSPPLEPVRSVNRFLA